MSIKYQYKPLNESPYASLGKLGSPYRSLNFGNAAQAAPMQIAPDAMELFNIPGIAFNTPGTAFNTPVTDAVNNPYLGGMTGLPNNATPDFTDALPQSPSLLESLKGYIPGGFLDSTDEKGIKTQGWGGPALGVVSGLGNAYMGMQQLNLAKETLANNKRQFDMNWGAQKQLTNNRIRGKWADQNAASGGKGPSEEEYMKTRRIA